MTKDELTKYFTHHPPKEDQAERYQKIRDAALHLGEVILENSTPTADQTAAIRLLRECVWTANSGIACHE